MTTINYIAKKTFKYNGRMVKAGTEWKTAGAKFDAQVKEHLVNPVERIANPTAKKRAVKRGTSSK